MKFATAIALFAAAAAITPVQAHHNANAQFFIGKEVAVTGVLKEVRDISPHAIWAAQVGPDLWHFEAVSSNALRRQGILVKQDIVPGQTYTFYIAPSRTPGEKAGFLTGIMIKGKKITIVRG